MFFDWRRVLNLMVICGCLSCVLGGSTRSSCSSLSCPRSRRYVCGSDGKTYRNECLLEKKQCQNPILYIDYEGRCIKENVEKGCNNIACPKTRRYLCGSDGKTYRNECQLQKRACKGPHIDIVHEGRCGAGGDINPGSQGGAGGPDYPGSTPNGNPPDIVSDGTGELRSVVVSTIRISNLQYTSSRVNFLLAVTPGSYSDAIDGEELWRIGLYGSSDRNGEEVGRPHQPQVLSPVSRRKSLRPRSQLVFEVDSSFQMNQIGCGDMRYLCIEFGKANYPIPDFNLLLPGSHSIVTCHQIPCEAPKPLPFDPTATTTNNNNQPAPVVSGNNNGGPLANFLIVHLTGLYWSMQPIIIRNDARSLLRMRIIAPISNSSSTVNGRGLWRVAMFGSTDAIGSEPRFDYHHQILRDEDQNRAATPYFNMSFNAITDFDLMGVGCGQYKYLCIEFAKGENPLPEFYLPLNGDDTSIISCQRAKCLNPDLSPQKPTNEPLYQGTAQLARFGWEMNPLRKNPDGPSDVSFTLTITPHPITDIISGTGLWRVGVFGSVRDGDEPGEIYNRQVLNQLQSNQPLTNSPLIFDVQTTLDMRKIGCGMYKFLCIEFAKGDNAQPDYRMPLNGRQSLISCQNVPCLNADRHRPFRVRPTPRSRPPPPPPRGRPDPQPSTNQGGQSSTRRPEKVKPAATTAKPNRSTLSPYFHFWPTMSRPEPRNPTKPKPNHNQNTATQTPPRRPPPPPRPRPQPTQNEQEDQPTNNPVKISTNQPNHNNPDSQLQLQPQPNNQVEPNPSVYIETPRQRYVPTPDRKVVWFSAIRWKASVEKIFRDGDQEINLDVMLLPHNNRVNALMGEGLWRMGIFGSLHEDGRGPRHDYKPQILGPFEEGNPLIPPNFLQFDVDAEFDIKSIGCGAYKYVCVEFDKGENPSIEFDLVVEDGVLGPIISCQAAPCAASTTFLTTRGPPNSRRPHVIINHVRLDEISITEAAQNQLDIDVEVVYNQRSDQVTGSDLWRLELWTSAKPDGSGTRLASLNQALDETQRGKALVRPYPFSFTNVRMNIDMRGNRCSYVRYICARLSNDVYSTADTEFDLTGEPSHHALIGCAQTQCHRSHGASAHPNTRPVVRFSGISVAIPTIEENRLNKLALRVTVGVSLQSDAVSGSQLWQLNVWGSKKANGNGYRYSNTEQALSPQQSDMSVAAPNDLFFEYVRFDLDMTRARCDNIAYICSAISTGSNSFDIRGEPNEGSLIGCTTVTCQAATVPEFFVNSVAILLPPTPMLSNQQNPVTMDFEIVYDVSNSDQIDGDNIWRVKIWGSSRANGGGARIAQSGQALTETQASQPMILGRPFTIRGIEYNLDLRDNYCRDISHLCAQLVAGKNSFKIKPVPNKKSLISCQRIHCING